MAIISNFELLYKPIAPVAGPASEIGRIVVQGYFLQISNLENRDINLIFRTRTPVRGASDSVNTEFTTTNHVVAFDITQDNNIDTILSAAGEQIPDLQLGHFVSCLVIPQGQTASLAILPNAATLLASPVADLAIRGYAELVLSDFDPETGTLIIPQSANVLVSAEHRGTFIDPDFDPADINTQSDLDFDQLAYSLNTANGQALQVINTWAPFNDPFQSLVTNDALRMGLIDRISNIKEKSMLSSEIDMYPKKITDLKLSKLAENLSKDANVPERSVSFKIGIVPVTLKYSIQDGQYVLNEKSLIKAVKMVLERKKIDPETIGLKEFAKKINEALAGNKKAEREVYEVLFKII